MKLLKKPYESEGVYVTKATFPYSTSTCHSMNVCVHSSEWIYGGISGGISGKKNIEEFTGILETFLDESVDEFLKETMFRIRGGCFYEDPKKTLVIFLEEFL